MNTSTLPPTYSPPEIAERFGVSPDKVVGWIRSGELPAMNMATRGSRRPRFRITAEALSAFEAGRAVVTKPPKRSRRKAAAVPVREFFDAAGRFIGAGQEVQSK